MTACWMNGSLVDADRATVSVFDHGLLYGDGVFEGIRFYNGVAFRLQEHLHRLELSARAIVLTLPCDRQELAAAVRQTIDASGDADGYIRLVATRGEGKLGIDPRSCGRANLFAVADQLSLLPPEVRGQGARLIIAATRRLGPDGSDSPSPRWWPRKRGERRWNSSTHTSPWPSAWSCPVWTRSCFISGSQPVSIPM